MRLVWKNVNMLSDGYIILLKEYWVFITMENLLKLLYYRSDQCCFMLLRMKVWMALE